MRADAGRFSSEMELIRPSSIGRLDVRETTRGGAFEAARAVGRESKGSGQRGRSGPGLGTPGRSPHGSPFNVLQPRPNVRYVSGFLDTLGIRMNVSNAYQYSISIGYAIRYPPGVSEHHIFLEYHTDSN